MKLAKEMIIKLDDLAVEDIELNAIMIEQRENEPIYIKNRKIETAQLL